VLKTEKAYFVDLSEETLQAITATVAKTLFSSNFVIIIYGKQPLLGHILLRNVTSSDFSYICRVVVILASTRQPGGLGFYIYVPQ
jgi:bifunctional N-acetylglucosamine-1-phosphate-uridyltransferase/glucosamine-1-phosphate-acetyltransferase GlmU-like protein